MEVCEGVNEESEDDNIRNNISITISNHTKPSHKNDKQKIKEVNREINKIE